MHTKAMLVVTAFGNEFVCVHIFFYGNDSLRSLAGTYIIT